MHLTTVFLRVFVLVALLFQVTSAATIPIYKSGTEEADADGEFIPELAWLKTNQS
ncbi:hypothetical protein C8J57DRAFT_1501592 [Mycena rebaudengoi]|nr:hypothetical protein C8J57DRAFT_1501592 [Mycena rebaudengoi]